MNKTAQISNFYFYDKRGRRKSSSKSFDEVKKLWLNNCYYKYSPLYAEYVTFETYHVINVIAAFYDAVDDCITVVNRDSI